MLFLGTYHLQSLKTDIYQEKKLHLHENAFMEQFLEGSFPLRSAKVK